MAETGDLIKEFKSAKPPEKVVIVLGIAAVGGIAIYLYRKSFAGGAATPATSTAAQGGQQAGFPSTSTGIPVLPGGVNPVFDPNGNLIAFQPSPPPPAPPPTPPPPPNPNQLTTQQLLRGESFRPVPPLRIPSPSGQNGQQITIKPMIPSNTVVTKTMAKPRVM